MATPTPLRDKLNINPEDGFSVGDTPQALKQYQREVCYFYCYCGIVSVHRLFVTLSHAISVLHFR